MEKKIVLGCKYNWCKPCWERPIHENEVNYIEELKFTGIMEFFFRVLYSTKIRRYFGNLLDRIKKIFYRSMCRKLNLNASDSIILVVYDQNEMSHEYGFFKYIIDNYTNVKTCYLFTNIVKLSRAASFNGINMLNKSFTSVFAFDYNDSLKYHFRYNYLIYDRAYCLKQEEPETDLFFVGQAKNRLDKILNIYCEATRLNLVIDFNCVNISDAELHLINGKNIHTMPLSYDEVVNGIRKSRCVLDIMQRDSIGCSLNICEAIFYGKKIITDNAYIVNEPFYSESRIYVIGQSQISLEEFIKEPMQQYTEDERYLFSAKHLFNII